MRHPKRMWRKRVHPEDRDAAAAAVDALMAGPDTYWFGEYRFQHVDGHYLAIADSSFVIRNEAGTIVRMLCSLTDVTSQRETENRLRQSLRCFELGADDFLMKPYHGDELVARARGIIRRSNGYVTPELKIGDLVVDTEAREVRAAGIPVTLTRREYQLVEILAMRQGTTVSKDALLTQMYGGLEEPEVKILDVYICKIRRKLEVAAPGLGARIETAWGRGYAIKPGAACGEALPAASNRRADHRGAEPAGGVMNLRSSDLQPAATTRNVAPRRAALLVDDDDMVRDTVTMQLESAGWSVAAANVSDARAKLLADPTIAVVVCDIHLINETGFDLAGALTDLRPEDLATEIVFIGNASGDTAIEALRHRAFDLIRKPVRQTDLVDRVSAAHRSAERRRQQQALLGQLEQSPPQPPSFRSGSRRLLASPSSSFPAPSPWRAPRADRAPDRSGARHRP